MSQCQYSQHERWAACTLPGAPVTEENFRQCRQKHNSRRTVIYPAVPLRRAQSLADFQLPLEITFDSCLRAGLRPRDFRASLVGWHPGSMLLPDGRVVHARHSESRAYATLDPALQHELTLPHERFVVEHGTRRSTVTHDGLPFQLPVEMQGLVHSIILTAWELELDKPGDLTSYTLKTRHAATRGFNYYQRVEPYYRNFLRLIKELARDPDFAVYPLSNYLTHTWLGGNLRLAKHWTDAVLNFGSDGSKGVHG